MRSGKSCGCGWGWQGYRPRGIARSPRIAAWIGKTVRRYVEAAQAAGLRRDDDASALDDGLIGAVAEAVRPAPARCHGAAVGAVGGVRGADHRVGGRPG